MIIHTMKPLLTIILISSFCSSSLIAKTNHTNVLFISADDLNIDMGCYGNKQVKTPHLDQLAKRGVRFDLAYCQQPLCGPSRASVMTGLRPNTTQFYANKDDLREKVPDVVTLGQFFQKKGYYVGRVGKIYHYSNPGQIGTDGHDDAATWQERFNPVGIDKKQEDKIINYGDFGVDSQGKPKKKKGLGISMAWWDPVSQDEEHTDGLVASAAIKMIDKNKDKPFFVAAGFFNPHCPYVAPKRYFDMYPLDEIEMQDLESAKKDLEDVPPMAIQRDSKNWPYYFKGITLDEARKCKQAYYATISFIDAQVGRLIQALEERDLMKNTIIVFWSDHGYFLGEKGLWYKRKNFERSLRVPLIFAGAGIEAKKDDCYQPVELLDLYPTLVDYTGFEIPKVLEGRSLRPLLTNPKSTWDKPAISQVIYSPKKAYGYSIRTERWRYTEWMKGDAGIELYDHDNDPNEITNLANNAEFTKIQKELSEQLAPYTKLKH
ncbi:MAG: sulfatase [Verrucomicrobiota bacterium]